MKRAVVLAPSSIALIAFSVCGYLGYFAAARITYRYRQSTSLGSLSPQQARPIRELIQALHNFELSRIQTQYSPTSLKNEIDYLEGLRAKARQEAWPIIDLRTATDYTVLAQLERETNDLGDAATHRQRAEALYRTLGWKDISAKVLNDVADKQLRSVIRE